MQGFRKLSGIEMNRLSVEHYCQSPKHPLVLMLHNIRSMWNVGSMFRSADAARIEKIILSGYTATPPRKEIAKTALGAQDTVVWEYHADPLEAVCSMKREGVRICGLEITEGSRPYTAVNAGDFPICLVVGNEVDGLENEILDSCDDVLEIPQYGTKHSLNVAVAAGIALFELVHVFRRSV
ncbi:RNA methyltransferase [Pelodictyon phaeoclathratiforme]|jgi:tRNA G18 (ribose-2'-O)-methylase SpoU|uniref:tRNA/rRNA methyltransferase (SpoU) n=1 Tax=Pelodictyon phaeoclathratiforme (strain DSM 5477 / BU-1) TaxID=324925 RepID=B4SGL9_PELPB|nr:RNA methyltransferase [Pelodictyon phaeoclathratiforme]ACF43432.1 tRNA/rRNA methyltransferase (SpoU) [Pelodictyon phaeoclathratiforme BU-1]MBV5288539.1 RNA methyltransferase [Pelodictyon phaeoclathratiforme]